MSLKPSLHWLLVFVPVAVVLRIWPVLGGDVALFVCCALAIVPLAGLMGHATEQLGNKLGAGVGGFLNATFGNAAELIIGLIALSKGLTDVVKASITGSIIGNLLLVFGASALAGGAHYRELRFNRSAMRASMSSLSLAVVALIIPTVFHITADARSAGSRAASEQNLSLAIAVVLFLCYICVLIFSLKTHRQLFRGGLQSGKPCSDDEVSWSRARAIVVLIVATALVALLSEFLVGTIESVRAQLGLTEVFVGVIIVAIIGNAAEHSTAVMSALKNKMDLSLGIAIGSSLQIALFVAPVLLFISHLFGAPMTLEFTLPEIVAVAVAVQLAFQIGGDGETNWLEGVQLLSVYLVLALLFYYLPPDATRH